MGIKCRVNYAENVCRCGQPLFKGDGKMYLLLFLLWLVFNGRVTLEILLIGVLVTAAVGWFMYAAFSYTVKTELKIWRIAPLIAEFWAALIVEVIKANIKVTQAVLNKKRPLKQTLVTFDMDLKHSFTRYLFANSITLTPGTITVDVDGSRFVVHCLSEDLLDGVESGRIAGILRRVEAKI